MTGEAQGTAILIIILVFVVNAVLTGRRRQNKPTMRPISAFESLPTLAAESIESSRPIHFSAGSAGIGTDSTLLALVNNEFLYQVARRVNMGDASPIFTVTETAALPLYVDTLRRAYQSQDRLRAFSIINVRWYPTGLRSLAFAAGAGAMQGEEQITANVLSGSFGVELVYIIDAATRRNRPVVAGSNRLTGQAVAFALADDVLIGEEMFAAAGYLDDNPAMAQRNIVLDMIRWLLVLALLAIAGLTAVNTLTGG